MKRMGGEMRWLDLDHTEEVRSILVEERRLEDTYYAKMMRWRQEADRPLDEAEGPTEEQDNYEGMVEPKDVGG